MTQALRMQAAHLTHQGLVRKANEDSVLQRDDLCLWVVADGMGGHEGGKFASSTVVETLDALQRGELKGSLLDEVRQAIGAANAKIYQTAGENRRMGTTVVGLVSDNGAFTCFWAGDSRGYLLRGGKLYRLTQDHTRVQDMVDAGLITAEEAATHPLAHALSRAVGVQAEVELGAIQDVLLADDVFLLCSDGLHGVVKDSEITEVLLRQGPASACAALLDLVLRRGAPDNVTIIAIACQQATALSFTAGARG